MSINNRVMGLACVSNEGLDSKIDRSAARVSRGLQTPSERVSCAERVCNPRLTKCGLRLWRSRATREIMAEIRTKLLMNPENRRPRFRNTKIEVNIMTEPGELAERYNEASESGETLEFWIPAKHVISKGVLGVVKSGIVFITADYSSELKVDRWPFDRIRSVRMVESLISPQIILDLKDKNLYFRVVNAKDAGPFKSAVDAMPAQQKTMEHEKGGVFDIEEIEIETEFADFEEPPDDPSEDAADREPFPKTPKYSGFNDSYSRTPKIIGCLALIVILSAAGWFIQSVVVYLKDVDVHKSMTAERSGGEKSVTPANSGLEDSESTEPLETVTKYSESIRKIESGKIIFHSFDSASDIRLRAIRIPMAGIDAESPGELPDLKIYTSRIHGKRNLRPDMVIASPIRKKFFETNVLLPGTGKKAHWADYEFGAEVILKSGTYWIGLEPNPEGPAGIRLFKDSRKETLNRQTGGYDSVTDHSIRGGDRISFIVSGSKPETGKPLLAEPVPGVFLLRSFRHDLGDPAGIAMGPSEEIALIGNSAVIRWDSNRILLKDIETSTKRRFHPIRFGPDGTSLIWASDKSVKWAPFDRPDEIREFKAEGMDLSAMDISPDAAYIVTGKFDGRIQIWNVTEGSASDPMKLHGGPVRVVSIHPGGKMFAAGGRDLNVRLWSMDGKEITVLKGHWAEIAAIRFSSDGKTLVSGSVDGNIKIWDLSNYALKTTFLTPTQQLTDLALAPDGETLFASSGNRMISVWDIPGRREISRFKTHSPYIQSMYSRPGLSAIRPDGRTLVSTAGYSSLKLWRLDYERLRNSGRRFKGSPEREPVRSLLEIDPIVSETNRFHGKTAIVAESAVGPGGEIIAVAGEKGGIEVWNRKGELVGRFRTVLKDIKCMAVSPDNEMLAVGGDGGAVVLRIADGQELSRFSEGTFVLSLTFSIDSLRLGAGRGDGAVVIREPADKKVLKRFEAGRITAMKNVVMSGDQKWIASRSYQKLHLWDAESGEPVDLFEEPADNSAFIDFIPGGNTLIAAGKERVVKANMNGGMESTVFDLGWTPSRTAALSPDGKLMALADAETILLWDVETNKPALAFKSGHFSRICGLAFGPDSGNLTSLAENNTIKTWRVDVKKLLGRNRSSDDRGILYSTGDTPSNGGGGLGYNGETEYFELEKTSKIERIEFYMKDIDIVDPYSFPVLRIRDVSDGGVIAAATSADARNAYFEPRHYHNSYYWVGFNFSSGIVLEKGKYEIELESPAPLRAGFITVIKAEKDRKRCLFKVFGDAIQSSNS